MLPYTSAGQQLKIPWLIHKWKLNVRPHLRVFRVQMPTGASRTLLLASIIILYQWAISVVLTSLRVLNISTLYTNKNYLADARHESRVQVGISTLAIPAEYVILVSSRFENPTNQINSRFQFVTIFYCLEISSAPISNEAEANFQCFGFFLCSSVDWCVGSATPECTRFCVKLSLRVHRILFILFLEYIVFPWHCRSFTTSNQLQLAGPQHLSSASNTNKAVIELLSFEMFKLYITGTV